MLFMALIVSLGYLCPCMQYSSHYCISCADSLPYRVCWQILIVVNVRSYGLHLLCKCFNSIYVRCTVCSKLSFFTKSSMRTVSIVTTCVSRAVGKCLPTLLLVISIRMTGNPPDRIFLYTNEWAFLTRLETESILSSRYPKLPFLDEWDPDLRDIVTWWHKSTYN